jgi:small subunit ribosomal protein S3
MGQKVHPYGFRIGYNRTWHSRWYAEKDYLKFLHDDIKLREELKRDLANAAVSEVEIERGNKLKINIMTARPGVIIGKKGASVDQLRDRLQQRLGKDIHVNIIEIQRPETDAQLVAESIAMQLERRVAFRRPPQRRRDRALRVVPGRPSPAPHPQGRHRLRLRGGADDVRKDRRQVLDLQG